MGIKHSFVSGIADGTRAASVRPSNWNADHIIDGPVDLPLGSTLGGSPFGTGPAGPPGPAGTTNLDYIDIRDFGTVVDGGDITAALNAAIASTLSTQFVVGFPNGKRIRIPWVGEARYTLGNLTFPVTGTSNTYIFEFHCNRITLTETFRINTVQSGTIIIRGLSSGSFGAISAPTPNPSPGPWFDGGTLNPAIQIENGTVRMENITVTGKGTALLIASQNPLGADVSTHTLSHCQFNSHSFIPDAAPLVCETYWVNMEHLLIGTDNAQNNLYCIEIKSPRAGDVIGITNIDDVLMLGGKGILIKPTGGSGGGGLFDINRLSNESMQAEGALVNLDSTDNIIAGVSIRNAWVADPAGNAYVLRNVGHQTHGVHVQFCEGYGLSPDSDEIFDLRFTDFYGFTSSASVAVPSYTRSYIVDCGGTLDAKLATAPRAPQLVVGTVLPVIQDPASWVVQFGDVSTTITPGFLDPDGGTGAGQVAHSGNFAGAICFSQTPSPVTFSVGDWFIAGCWCQRDITDPQPDLHALTAILPAFSIEHNGFVPASQHVEVNGSENTQRIGLRDGQTLRNDGAWIWVCDAFKITSFLGGPANDINLVFKLGPQSDVAVGRFYNPSVQYFPVSLGIKDGDVMALARSYKGGWPPTAARSDVAILDTQALRVGTTKYVAKTFATLPASPVAGQQAYITDCNTNVLGNNAAAGGANKVLIWYNGTNWTVIGK